MFKTVSILITVKTVVLPSDCNNICSDSVYILQIDYLQRFSKIPPVNYSLYQRRTSTYLIFINELV